MSRCDKASGTASKKSNAAAVDATAQILAKSTGVPFRAVLQNRTRSLRGLRTLSFMGNGFRTNASATSRMAEISPTSLLNIGSQFSAVYFSALPTQHRLLPISGVNFHTVGHDHSGFARTRQTPACIATIFLHIELHFRNRERLQSRGNPCRTKFCFPSAARSYSWCLWSWPCSAECRDGEEIRG